MKKLVALVFGVAFAQFSYAQAPQKMSYQSVIRNATHELIIETTVGIQISILQGTSLGAAVYVESHAPMTNINGLVSLELGMGTPVSGTFTDIDWGNGPYFIQTETDPDGGTSYALSGVSELLSVPYAIFANEAANVTFSTSGNVTSNALGDYATDDFVFGSPAFDDDGNSDYYARMLFDKSKGAFRVGSGSFGAWDDQNIGYGSTALGESIVASGDFSAAMGLSITASGYGSVATGVGTISSGDYTSAMGLFSTASGYSSVSLGNGSLSSGSYSFSMGYDASAEGDYSIAIGESTVASGNHSTALGKFTTANGYSSVAMGSTTVANGLYSFAMGGFETSASGSVSVSMGSNTTASGLASVALGFSTTASGISSLALGRFTTASGYVSTAMGRGTTAPSRDEMVIGAYNTDYLPQGGTDDWNALDRLFVIGNGTFDTPSDAIVVLKNGNVGLGTSKPNEIIEVGGDGRAFFGDGQGDNRKGILIDGIQGEGAARIEAFDYGTGTGLDLVLNTATSGGNVGIRTNSPTATLSVNGSANKTGGGSWAVFSDRRLKKDIKTYEDGLSIILAIDPVTFKYNSISKADTINEYIGVIAQELEKVTPYMINTIVIDGTDYLEVDNSAMTYILINAIKELNTTIETQNTQIVDLKAENETKDVRLDNLDSKLQANTKLLQELNSVLKTQTKR